MAKSLATASPSSLGLEVTLTAGHFLARCYLGCLWTLPTEDSSSLRLLRDKEHINPNIGPRLTLICRGAHR